MAKFSSDVDILKYEPVLFGELHLPSQVLACGADAVLNGTTLTAADADFQTANAEAGGVIHLKSTDGSLDGAYEIVSVDSSTELTVSVVRSHPSDPPVAPVASSEIRYRVSTFGPQAADAAFQLTEYFGIQPGNPASPIAIEQIVDVEGLRKASALAVISRVYASWTDGTDNECARKKSLLYAQLYEKARQRCHITVDLDSDGTADITRLGGAIRLVRD